MTEFKKTWFWCKKREQQVDFAVCIVKQDKGQCSCQKGKELLASRTINRTRTRKENS